MNTTTAPPTGEPKLASIASWAVLGASFGLSATTWIAMAVLAGFTETATLSGITLRMAWLMPISVDGYVVVALVLWMSPVPAKVAKFAKWNTYFAAGTGIAAQSAYHLLITASATGEQWRVIMAAIVGALPPTLAGLAIHMRALIRRESSQQQGSTTTSTTVPAPSAPITYVPAPTTPIPLTPEIPAAIAAPVPTPAVVAPRMTAARQGTRTTQAPPRPAPRPSRPRTSPSGTAATPQDPSPTDSSVNAPEAFQLALPMVSPAKLAAAPEIAAQYLAEHGTPITANQLSVRLRVPSEQAAQILDLLHTTPAPASTPVNGHTFKAA